MKVGIFSTLAISALLISACQTTASNQGITVDTSAMLSAEAAAAEAGWTQITGKEMYALIAGQTFNYTSTRGSEISNTMGKNGVSTGTWKSSNNSGSWDELWTVEKGEFVCWWDDDNKDSCATMWVNDAGGIARINTEGDTVVWRAGSGS